MKKITKKTVTSAVKNFFKSPFVVECSIDDLFMLERNESGAIAFTSAGHEKVPIGVNVKADQILGILGF